MAKHFVGKGAFIELMVLVEGSAVINEMVITPEDLRDIMNVIERHNGIGIDGTKHEIEIEK